MRVLVTGSSGFIGSRLIHALRARHEVFGITRPRTTTVHNPTPYLLEQDLAEPLDYGALPARIDAVIHLAQSRAYRQFPEKAEDIFAVNIHSTFRLLEYARRAGAQSFVFASSGGVYGYSYEKLVETAPLNPLNFYLSSKHTAELLIANYRRFFRTVVLRFFFVYGPGQKAMLIPSLLRRVQTQETITVEGRPGLRVNPIYVDDAIRVFEPALHRSESDLFNVAGDEEVTVTDLLLLMGKVTAQTPTIQYVDTQARGDLVGDNSRMKDLLGVRPLVGLEEGLRATALDAETDP